jgi:hypothetical protein
MLNNTLGLHLSPGVSDATTVSRIDTDNGSSVYKYAVSGAEYYQLKVQNLETKENAPVGTNRIQVRIEHVKVLETGLQRTAFVSMVLASPRDVSFTNSQLLGLVQALVAFLCDTGDMDAQFATGEAAAVLVLRLLSGEV